MPRSRQSALSKWKERAKEFKALWVEAEEHNEELLAELKSRQRECAHLKLDIDDIIYQCEEVERLMAVVIDKLTP